MTSYSPEGLACLWEAGARECEVQARKLEAKVRKWKTRNNTLAVVVVANEWQILAKDLEDCACSIEKHYLNDLLTEVKKRKGWTLEPLNEAHDNEVAGRGEACEAATRKVKAKAHEWEGKVDDLRASARTWRDKASALLGDSKAYARLCEAEAREWEEKASEQKAGAQKLRAIADEWREEAQELENQAREAETKASALRGSN